MNSRITLVYLTILVALCIWCEQVLGKFPDSCSFDSECGDFSVCYGSKCRCRLSAFPKPDELGCVIKPCRYTSDCDVTFPNTKCDYDTKQCACKYDYALNSNTQTCEYSPSYNPASMWTWLGPVIGFSLLFPIIIISIRYYMIQRILKRGDQIVVSPIVVAGVVPAQQINQQSGNAYGSPPPPPPAYGSNYNTDYGQR